MAADPKPEDFDCWRTPTSRFNTLHSLDTDGGSPTEDYFNALLYVPGVCRDKVDRETVQRGLQPIQGIVQGIVNHMYTERNSLDWATNQARADYEIRQPTKRGRMVFTNSGGNRLLTEFDDTIRLAHLLNKLRLDAEAKLVGQGQRITDLIAENERLTKALRDCRHGHDEPMVDPSEDQLPLLKAALGDGLVQSATETDMSKLFIRSYQRWAQLRFRFWWALWRDDPYWSRTIPPAHQNTGDTANHMVHGADLVDDLIVQRCEALAETLDSIDARAQLRISGEMFGVTYRVSAEEAEALIWYALEKDEYSAPTSDALRFSWEIQYINGFISWKAFAKNQGSTRNGNLGGGADRNRAIRNLWLQALVSPGTDVDLETCWDLYLNAVMGLVRAKQQGALNVTAINELDTRRGLLESCIQSHPWTGWVTRHDPARFRKGWVVRLPHSGKFPDDARPPDLITRGFLSVPDPLPTIRKRPQDYISERNQQIGCHRRGYERWRTAPPGPFERTYGGVSAREPATTAPAAGMFGRAGGGVVRGGRGGGGRGRGNAGTRGGGGGGGRGRRNAGVGRGGRGGLVPTMKALAIPHRSFNDWEPYWPSEDDGVADEDAEHGYEEWDGFPPNLSDIVLHFEEGSNELEDGVYMSQEERLASQHTAPGILGKRELLATTAPEEPSPKRLRHT
ncbi:hypothetical protein SUNI508_01092 [Seiridium unicorne]|uniref:Uncharacterized protein n=1 Tax=Seiridium unicorne TaxID=138068 RepID=A0ABR2UXV9_9PEZI